MSNDMVCSACQLPKNQLKVRKSKLLPGTTLYLCGGCFENKNEPRFAVVLVARENGVPAVSEWIKNHRYVGAPITAKELA